MLFLIETSYENQLDEEIKRLKKLSDAKDVIPPGELYFK